MMLPVGANRVALFALISGLEQDFRRIFIRLIISGINPEEIFLPDEIVIARERAEKHLQRKSNDTENIEFLDLMSEIQALKRSQSVLNHEEILVTNVSQADYERLGRLRNAVMHGRPLEFSETAFGFEFLKKVSVTAPACTQVLSDTFNAINSDPGFVVRIPFKLEHLPSENVSHNLPLPDFDDTGFVGRKRLRKDLLARLLGPHPIITIVGLGGMGKTALALQAAFDLIDSNRCGFDFVIWYSAKSMRLGVKEIVDIDAEIKSAGGVLSSIENLLGSSINPIDNNNINIDNLIDNISDGLSKSKALIIIDNLESIIDNSIIKLAESVPHGSKILFTSRISPNIGLTMQVEGLLEEEAVSYLMQLASVYNCKTILNTDNAEKKKIVSNLYNNPLFLKWFILSVNAGSSPFKLQINPENPLKFSFNNIFEHLPSEALLVCHAIAMSPGPHTLARLQFLAELGVEKLESAVMSLLASKLIEIESSGSNVEPKYSMPQVVRKYFSNFNTPNEKDQHSIQKQIKALRVSYNEFTAQVNVVNLEIEKISLRDVSDVVIAWKLQGALRASRSGDFNDARLIIEDCKRLSPSYSEVYRVAGFIEDSADSALAAESAYNMSVEIDPNNVAGRFFYGGFLLRSKNDVDGAIVQFECALNIAPESSDIRRELARSLMYSSRFDEAEALIQHPSFDKGNDRAQQVLWDFKAQLEMRRCVTAINGGRLEDACNLVKSVVEAFKQIPPEFLDDRLATRARKFLPSLERLIRDCQKFRIEKVAYLEDQHAQIISIQSISQDTIDLSNTKTRGAIVRIPEGKKFGFIRTADGKEYFIHFSEIIASGKEELKIGTRIEFYLEWDSNQQKYRATNAEIIDRASKGV